PRRAAGDGNRRLQAGAVRVPSPRLHGGRGGTQHRWTGDANRWTLAGMAIDRLVAPLLRVPLFAGLKPLQLTELARQAERVKFQRGDVITKAGEPGDGAYL